MGIAKKLTAIAFGFALCFAFIGIDIAQAEFSQPYGKGYHTITLTPDQKRVSEEFKMDKEFKIAFLDTDSPGISLNVHLWKMNTQTGYQDLIIKFVKAERKGFYGKLPKIIDQTFPPGCYKIQLDSGQRLFDSGSPEGASGEATIYAATMEAPQNYHDPSESILKKRYVVLE